MGYSSEADMWCTGGFCCDFARHQHQSIDRLITFEVVFDHLINCGLEQCGEQASHDFAVFSRSLPSLDSAAPPLPRNPWRTGPRSRLQ